MILRLEHLSAYTDYGLQMSQGKGNRTIVVGAAYEDHEGLKVLSKGEQWWNLNFWTFKPVLISIDDVLNDDLLTVNGDKIIEPYKRIFPNSGSASSRLPIIQPEKLPHDKYRLLASWGVDLFGLIPSGLAYKKSEI